MNVVTRGIRNAFRNSIRTFSIVVIIGLAIGLSLAMLIARQAVSSKIASVNSSVGNTVTITPAGFSSFSSVNNALTTTELSKVSTLPHITGLDETLTDRLTTIGSTTPSFGGNSSSSNPTSLSSPITIKLNQTGGGPGVFISGGGSSGLPSNFSPPITIIGTNNPSSVNGSAITLTSGTLISGSTNNNQAMVSSSMASKNNLKVGSTFTAYSKNLTVTGIYSDTNNALSNDVIVSLPTEQALSGETSDITSAIATVDSLTNLSSATSEIKNALGSSADVTSSVQQAQNTTAPLDNIKSITLYSLIGALVAGAVIIFLIMIMIVRERRREIGVLKAIGASNLKVMWQFMSEAITLTLLGAVIGIIIGAAAANPITKTLVNNSSSSTTTSASVRGGSFRAFNGGGGGNFSLGPQSTRGAFRGVRNSFSNIHAIVGWSIIIYGILSALIIAIIGSTAASLLIARIRPAEVIRTE